MLEISIIVFIALIVIGTLAYFFFPSRRSIYDLGSLDLSDPMFKDVTVINIDATKPCESYGDEKIISDDIDYNWKINISEDHKESITSYISDLVIKLNERFGGFLLYQASKGDPVSIEYIKRFMIRSHHLDNIERMSVVKKTNSKVSFIFTTDYILLSILPMLEIKFKLKSK